MVKRARSQAVGLAFVWSGMMQRHPLPVNTRHAAKHRPGGWEIEVSADNHPRVCAFVADVPVRIIRRFIREGRIRHVV